MSQPATVLDDDEPLSAEDEAFLMSNLYPRRTGLPMTVWVGPKGGARHDVRIKVSQTHGEHFSLGEAAIVALRPEPRLVHGKLSSADFAQVAEWALINRDVIIDHWDGRADSFDLVERLQSLTSG